MIGFVKFPHTPHIAWLADGSPRDDKILSDSEVRNLLSGVVYVEEKIDGANVGLSINEQGRVCVQNRGQYLSPPYYGQFSRLESWLSLHQLQLIELLEQNFILFGEWCAAQHSIHYSNLPDWFLVFDVYDKKQQRFWSVNRRNELAHKLNMTTVPLILNKHTDLDVLRELLTHKSSSYREGTMEGLVVRKDSENWCETRGKLVHTNFMQTMDEHWSKRTIRWNNLCQHKLS